MATFVVSDNKEKFSLFPGAAVLSTTGLTCHFDTFKTINAQIRNVIICVTHAFGYLFVNFLKKYSIG